VLTYAEVSDQVQRLAAGLQAPALSTIREIGLLSENRPEWALAYLAVVGAGKTVVPIDANLKASEVEAIVRHAGLQMMFVSGRWERTIVGFAPDIRLLSLESDSPNHWQTLNANPLDFTPIGSRDSIAALIYTSGTTGSPKAVVLTHGNLLANIEGIVEAILIDERDVFLSVLPLHHTFESTCGFFEPAHPGRGGRVRSVAEVQRSDRGDRRQRRYENVRRPLLYEKMYHAIRRKIQAAPLPKRLIVRVLLALSDLGWSSAGAGGGALQGAAREVRHGELSYFRIRGGGAPVPYPQILRASGLRLHSGYGMTECSPVISVQRPDDIRLGSVGPPLKGVEVRIDGPDSTGVGEIVVRGENCSPGYRDCPDQTAALWRDGWLHTGDLGRLKEGHLWITGRAKNLIISAGGKNIYPEEIEERLMVSDHILEAVVFGRTRPGRHGKRSTP